MQEKSIEVSLCVSWILNKRKPLFATSEVAKECMVENAKVLCPGKVEKLSEFHSQMTLVQEELKYWQSVQKRNSWRS